MILLLSGTMIGVGALFIKKPPKDINVVLGYRTNMSRINVETWKYAHKVAGKTWVYAGCITIVILPSILYFMSAKTEKGILSMFALITKIIVIDLV